MKNYGIIKTKTEYKYVVFSTSYVSSIDKLSEISEELCKQRFIGNVLFDLVLSNGFAYNRFIEIYFDGKKFDETSAKIISNAPKQITDQIYQLYYNNPKYIDNSILPMAQRYLLKNRLLINS